MIGEILDGKYRIDRQLGAGGMGNVYLATHLRTTRVVAVKVIAPRWAADPHFLARFQREAQACGRLLISRAVVPAETVSWSSRIREQT